MHALSLDFDGRVFFVCVAEEKIADMSTRQTRSLINTNTKPARDLINQSIDRSDSIRFDSIQFDRIKRNTPSPCFCFQKLLASFRVGCFTHFVARFNQPVCVLLFLLPDLLAASGFLFLFTSLSFSLSLSMPLSAFFTPYTTTASIHSSLRLSLLRSSLFDLCCLSPPCGCCCSGPPRPCQRLAVHLARRLCVLPLSHMQTIKHSKRRPALYCLIWNQCKRHSPCAIYNPRTRGGGGLCPSLKELRRPSRTKHKRQGEERSGDVNYKKHDM